MKASLADRAVLPAENMVDGIIGLTLKFIPLGVVCSVASPGFTVSVVPSPKFHSQDVGFPVLESVNVTVNGTSPDVVLAEKAAVGADSAAVTVI